MNLQLTDVELVVDQRILELQCAALLIEGDTMGAAMLMDRIGAGLGYQAYQHELEAAARSYRKPTGRPKGSKNKKRVWVNGKLVLESEYQRTLNLDIQGAAFDADKAAAVIQFASRFKGPLPGAKMTRAERKVWNSLTPGQREALDAMEAKGEVTVGFRPELQGEAEGYPEGLVRRVPRQQHEQEMDRLAQDHDDAVRFRDQPVDESYSDFETEKQD